MSLAVPDEYIDGFIRANNTFLFQLVYDPLQRRLRPLNSYEEGLNAQQLPYAGAYPFMLLYTCILLSIVLKEQ